MRKKYNVEKSILPEKVVRKGNNPEKKAQPENAENKDNTLDKCLHTTSGLAQAGV